jgi:hypothetical protein
MCEFIGRSHLREGGGQRCAFFDDGVEKANEVDDGGVGGATRGHF